MMFSRTVEVGMSPSALRFSEQNAIFCVIAARGVRNDCGVPPTAISPVLAWVGGEQQPGDLRTSRAEQPGQAHDLALVDRQAERRDRPGPAEPARLDQRAVEHLGLAVQPLQHGQLLADHLGDQLDLRQLRGRVLPDQPPVAQIVIRSEIS
ncbi:hypothetical protein GCM10020220_114380 [Nonomuraea rubra]